MSDLSDAAVTDARIGDIDMIVFLFFVATFVPSRTGWFCFEI